MWQTGRVSTDNPSRKKIERWFKSQGRELFDFQVKTWDAWERGDSGLVHSPTGSGKTLAAWLGPVQNELTRQDLASSAAATGVKLLWITPLRALANDTADNLQNSASALGCKWTVQIRTGDTSTTVRQKQRTSPPDVLVTTPESLSLLLSYANNQQYFAQLQTIIVDEWHELLGSKRGVQLDLCITRLRQFAQARDSRLKIWALSATMANLDTALQALLGDAAKKAKVISGNIERKVFVKTIIPPTMQKFPWSGHLGIQLADQAIDVIDAARSTLFFTNTRSQAELWFETITRKRPDWLGSVAIHHGSIDRKIRSVVEQRVRDGLLRCVVCTSSLDLGVDFSPVEQVVQVGSPKGIARLMQRAGRSGHRPGVASTVVCIPTNAFELVEFAAARRALLAGNIEERAPLSRSLDVLAQHLVTVALGSGFERNAMLDEIRCSYSFSRITDAEWNWILDFITRGGQALKGYPQFNRVVESNGFCRVPQGRIARQHRMSIGTISSDNMMRVKWMSGGTIGHIEESFIAKIKPGSTFLFSGRLVELVQTKDMTVFVKKSNKKRGMVPRWQGGRFPMSCQLADSVLESFALWKTGDLETPEIEAIDHLLKVQTAWSVLPQKGDFLVEKIISREGCSHFFYPFAGRLVHEGLGILIAWRLSQRIPVTLTISASDYGFELFGSDNIDVNESLLLELFNPANLLDDLLASLNSTEAAKRQFRDIARIAGLVFQGYPGSGKSTRQIQASSGLIYDVLKNYDRENLLLDQANREVLESQMEFKRMQETLKSITNCEIKLRQPQRLTPLAFPLWADRLQSQTVSSENWRQRVEKMLNSLESAAVETLHKPNNKRKKRHKQHVHKGFQD